MYNCQKGYPEYCKCKKTVGGRNTASGSAEELTAPQDPQLV